MPGCVNDQKSSWYRAFFSDNLLDPESILSSGIENLIKLFLGHWESLPKAQKTPIANKWYPILSKHLDSLDANGGILGDEKYFILKERLLLLCRALFEAQSFGRSFATNLQFAFNKPKGLFEGVEAYPQSRQ